MATHPVSNMNIKDDLIKRVIDVLLKCVFLSSSSSFSFIFFFILNIIFNRRGPAPDKRMISLICSAYAANVLENGIAREREREGEEGEERKKGGKHT